MIIRSKVSVIMPAYNASLYISQAVESVLNQTYQNLELIVVDDGSKDNTCEIVKNLANKDSRVILITQRNSGRPSITRNAGIKLATGDFISFLDSDDFWLPTRVQALVDGLEGHPEWVAVFHDLKLVNESGVDLCQIYLQDVDFASKAKHYLSRMDDDWWACDEQFYVFMSLYFAAIHTQSVMIARNRLHEERIFFDPQFVICEDTDLWIRVAQCGRLGFLNKVLSGYRQHSASITKDEILFASETLNFHQHNLARLKRKLSCDQLNLYKKKLTNCARELGYLQYSENNMVEARKTYFKVLNMGGVGNDFLALGKTFIPNFLLQFLRHR